MFGVSSLFKFRVCVKVEESMIFIIGIHDVSPKSIIVESTGLSFCSPNLCSMSICQKETPSHRPKAIIFMDYKKKKQFTSKKQKNTQKAQQKSRSY